MRKGFTLIELSIVFLIIGFLVAALSVGNELVRTATMQSIISDLREFESYSKEFRTKYYYWPGDMPNASSFWSIDATTAGEHDGNGDHDVDDVIGSVPSTYEGEAFWQHLYKAGFFETVYSGIATATHTNSPLAPIDSSRYITNDADKVVDAKLHITLSTGNASAYESMTTQQAFFIDNKMDNGEATTGIILGGEDVGDCYTGIAYNVDDDSPDQCWITFIIEE
ncbi:MAG: hypothetical protein COV36_08190 [Alphaproteobacteria bacterium CG11_big_fil_rev_8_21_14_0_20_44_7]|nr:MAG: hypothetical protein COV36_08190 [Alphaproteobacteria bacterium CG11_big_fil_rev_8_21_14_0_20_44_7]